ncbi:dihydroxyacetone kinase subunit DhaL [Leucobacter sp. HY1910]
MASTTLTTWIDLFCAGVETNRDWLTELDSAIGDADHGSNMARGMEAAAAKAAALAEAAGGPVAANELLKAVGMTLVSSIGGASGPLYGTFFLRAAVAAGPVAEPSASELAAALRAGLDGIMARGKAVPGDKTLVDAMAPAVEAFEAAAGSGDSAGTAAQAAATAAQAGRDATAPMVARKGRASYLGERSAGHIDPGAASTALLFEALAAATAATAQRAK